jgi:molecular chaperone DnaJ
MARSAQPRDPYDVLGVSRQADDGQVKKAFRQLARELHPDVNTDDPDAEEKFKEAAEAYEILSDPERRATYDRFGHEGLRSGGYQPNFDQFGSLGDLFEAFFGAGAGGIFGAAGGRRAASGGDVAVELDLDLAQAASGGSFEISYEAVDRCANCNGNGAEPGTPIETCSRCGGAGQLQAITRTPFGQVMRSVVCDTCGGDGRIAKQPCHECNGRGRRVVTRSISVDIPAGIADTQRVRLGGRGHAGEQGAPAGDLYVLVHVAEDERFYRDGDDLITLVDVSSVQAALGLTVEVPTLDGPSEVTIESGTQPGERVVLRGRGMPRLGRNGRGDLIVVVNVRVLRHLSAQQREMLEALSATITEENLQADETVRAKLRRWLRPHAA